MPEEEKRRVPPPPPMVNSNERRVPPPPPTDVKKKVETSDGVLKPTAEKPLLEKSKTSLEALQSGLQKSQASRVTISPTITAPLQATDEQKFQAETSSIKRGAEILKRTGLVFGEQVAQAPLNEQGKPIQSFSSDINELYDNKQLKQVGGVDYFSDLNKLKSEEESKRNIVSAPLPKQSVGTETLSQKPQQAVEQIQSINIQDEKVAKNEAERLKIIESDIDSAAEELGLDAQQKEALANRKKQLIYDYSTLPFKADEESDKLGEVKSFLEDAYTLNTKKQEASKMGISMEDLNYLEKKEKADKILSLLPEDMREQNKELFQITSGLRDFLSEYQDLTGEKGFKIDPKTGEIDLSGIKDERTKQYINDSVKKYISDYDKFVSKTFNVMNDNIVQKKNEARNYEMTLKRAELALEKETDYAKRKEYQKLIDNSKKELFELKGEINQMQKSKNSFFSVDPNDVKSEFKSSSSAKSIFSALPKDMSGKDKFDLFYNQLISKNEKLAKELGIKDTSDESFGAGMKDFLDWDGIYSLSPKEKEYFANKKIIRSMAPLYLNNTAGITKQSGGFGGSFLDSFASWIQPKTEMRASETQIAREQLENISKQGFTAKDFTTDKSMEQLEKRVTDIPLLSQEFAGEMLGTTGAIMSEMIVGGALLSPLKSVKAVKSLGTAYEKAMDSSKVLKFVKPAVDQGIQMEAIGTLFNSAEDELNFTSGAVGGLGGELIGAMSKKLGSEYLAKYISSVFGSQSNKALYALKRAGEINNRGLGEVGEEVTQELIGIYNDELREKGFWDEVTSRYGNLSDIGKLVVSSYVMGSAFGMNTKSSAKEWYNSLPKEEKAIIDNIDKDVNSDVVESVKAVADKKAEIDDAEVTETPITEQALTETKPTAEKQFDVTDTNVGEMAKPIIETVEGEKPSYTDTEGKFYSEKEVVEMPQEQLSQMKLQNPSEQVLNRVEEVFPTPQELITKKEENVKSTTEERIPSVSESVSQGINGEVNQIDTGDEENTIQLRKRIEEARRKSSESGTIGQGSGSELDEQEQNKIAYEYAKETGTLIDNFEGIGKPMRGGNENDVNFVEEEGRVYKRNNLMNTGTIDNFLSSINLHNKFFPNTKYKFEGFSVSKFGKNPKVYPVYSQDFIENSKEASPQEIESYMANLGFEQIETYKYKKDNIEISDLRPRNVLKDEQGNIHVIDAEFKENIVEEQTIETKFKKVADNIRKLKTSPAPKLINPDTGEEIEITKMGLDWNDLVESVALAVEKTGDVVGSVQEYLGKQEWYTKLSDAGKKSFEKQIIDNLPQEEVKVEEVPAETKPKVEKQVPPSEPKQKKEKTEEGPKERSFGKRVLESEVSEEIKQGISDKGKNYVPTSNKISVTEANYIIQKNGIDDSINMVLDFNNGLSPRVRVTLGVQLIEILNKEATDKSYYQASRIADELSQYATELGQGVQVFSLWNKLDAEGIIRSYEKKQRESKERIKKKHTSTFEGVKEGYKSGTKSAGKKATQNVFGKSKSKASKIKAFGLDKEDIQKRKKLAEEKLRSALKKGGLTSGGLNSEAIEAIVEYGAMVFADGIRTFKEWSAKIKEVAPELSDDDLKSVWMNNESFGGKTFDELSKISEIEDVVSEHFMESSDVDSLSKKLQDVFGLDKDLADGLASEITDEFNKIVKSERQKEIDKKTPKLTKKVQQAIDEISEGENLTSKEIEEIILKAFGIEKLTEEQTQKIRDLVKERDARPKGFLKDEITRETLSYMASLNGISKKDIFWSMYYASILSGYETQILNIASNSLNITLESVVTSIEKALTGKGTLQERAGAIASVYSGLLKGAKEGYRELSQILATGHSARKLSQKLEAKDTLENVNFKGGKMNPANYYKYVGRFMFAVDSAAFLSANGSKKQELANEIAQKEGLSGQAMRDRVSEILNESEQSYNEAKEQATEEINQLEERSSEKMSERQKERLIKIRTSEIISEMIPDEIQEKANDYSSFVTYNYTPKGVLGSVATTLSGLGETVPAFKLVVPFTRVVANVLNQQIDYTPYGYLRASGFNFGSGMKNRTTAENIDQRNRLLIKATLGTIGMVSLYALAKSYEDDDDPYFEITGKGPSDMNKKNQLYSQGWRPYSIKIGDTRISYQYTPFGVALSYIGNWLDNEKYKELNKKDFLTKFVFAMKSSATGIMDMSFLTGLSGFFESLSRDSDAEKTAENFQKTAGKIATTFIPNLFKQLDKLYDPTIYDSKSIQASILKEIPIIKRYSDLKPKLNAFGQPVEKQGNRFYQEITKDPVWLFMAENRIFAPAASPNTHTIYGKEMSDAEFYEYMEKSGKLAYEYFKSNLSNIQSELDQLEDSEKQKYINEIFKGFRKEVKEEIGTE